MKVMLFLNGSNTQIMDGERSYGIVGCYFGKVFYDQDNVLHPATEFATDGVIALSDFKQPMKEENLIKSINETASISDSKNVTE